MDRKHGGFRCCLALLLLYLVGSALCLAPVIEAGRAGSQKNAVSRSQPRRGRGLQEDNSVASQKEAAFSIKPVVQQEDSTTDGDATGARTTLNFLNDAKPARMMSSLLPNTISNVEDLLHVVPNFLTDYYETIRKSPSLPKRSTEAQGDSARSGELLSSLLGGLTGNGASPISFIKPLTTGVTQGLSNLLPGSASAILDSTADASAAGTGASPGIPTATTSGVSEDILSLISAQPWLSGLLAHSANPAAIPTLDALSQLLQEINTTGRLGRLSLPQPLSAFFHSQPSELQTALGNGVLSLLNAAYPQAAYAASGGLGSDLLKFNPGLTSGVVGMSIGFGLGQTTTPPVVGAPNTSPADAVGGAVGSLLPAAADGSTRTRQDVAVSGTYGGSLGGGLGAYGLGGGEGLGIAELLGSLNGRGGAQGRGSTGGAGGAAGGVRGSGNLGGSARKASDPTSAATLLSSGVGALPGAVNGVGNILTSGLSALRVPTTALFPTSGSSVNSPSAGAAASSSVSDTGLLSDLNGSGLLGSTADLAGLASGGGNGLGGLGSRIGGGALGAGGSGSRGRGGLLVTGTSSLGGQLNTLSSVTTTATKGRPVASSLTSGSPRASSIIPSAPPARGSGDIPPVSSEVTAQNSGLLPSVQNAGGRQDTVDALLGGAGRSGLSSASTFPDEPLSLPLRDFLNVSPRTIDLSAFDDNNLGIQLEGKSAVQDHVKREKRYSDFLPGKAGMSGEKYSVLEFTSNTHQASSTPYTSGKGGSPRWPAAASVVDSSLASSRASTHPAPGTFNESKGVRPGVSASASSKDIQGSLRQTEEASKPKGVLTEQDRSRPGEVIVYALRSAEISAAPEGLAQMAAQ